MLRKAALPLIVSLLFFLVPVQTFAATATLHPAADAYTVSSRGRLNVNHGNGSLELVKAHPLDSHEGDWDSVMYLLFDLSGLPPRTKINSATLTMYQTNPSQQYNSSINITRALGHWSEQNLTYNLKPKETVPSGDDPYYTITPGNTQVWDITRLTQEWADGIYNFGLVIRLSEETRRWLSKFDSKEESKRELRPTLTIDYGPVDNSPLTISNVKGEFINPATAKISWNTNRYTDSLVEFRDTDQYKYADRLGISFQQTKNHVIYLENLKPNTTYHFRVTSQCDLSDSQTSSRCHPQNRIEKTTSPDYELKPTTTSSKAVTISNVRLSNLTENSTKILWDTDTSAVSYVEYGLTNHYGSTAREAGAGKSHSVTLSSLKPSTTYHFRIRSGLFIFGEGTSRDYIFTTREPVITISPSPNQIDWDRMGGILNKINLGTKENITPTTAQPQTQNDNSTLNNPSQEVPLEPQPALPSYTDGTRAPIEGEITPQPSKITQTSQTPQPAGQNTDINQTAKQLSPVF